MFHKCSTLVEEINVLVSRIVKLNSKLAGLRKEHKHERKALPRDRTSAIRCSKCEGYGHDVHQCPNWDASPMTHQELEDYIIYLKEVEMSAMKKLELLKKVRREKRAQREQERRETEKKTLREKEREREQKIQVIVQQLKELEKARQVKKLKREQEKKELRETKEKELKEREEKKRQENEEKEQRERQENESLLTPLTNMVETESLKGDCNTLNCCSYLHHDSSFSLGKCTNPSLFVLTPREDLYIKSQWHKKWGEEKMKEKEDSKRREIEEKENMTKEGRLMQSPPMLPIFETRVIKGVFHSLNFFPFVESSFFSSNYSLKDISTFPPSPIVSDSSINCFKPHFELMLPRLQLTQTEYQHMGLLIFHENIL